MLFGVALVRAGFAQPAVAQDGWEVPAAAALPVSGAQASDCTACHTGSAFEGLAVFHQDCTTCHDGSEAHLASPEIGTIAMPAAADCLSCHTRSDKLMHWESGAHARSQIGCSSCHNPHDSGLATEFRTVGARRLDAVSAACTTCHQEELAKFSLPSHHPVREGGLSCVSCHDPHGADQVTRLSKTDTCLTCHANHRGPMVFEHAPVAEDCSTCHVPHGSATPKLLELPQPALCLQCHSLADNRHGLGAVAGARVSGAALRNCTGCHAAIHGSASDAILRF